MELEALRSLDKKTITEKKQQNLLREDESLTNPVVKKFKQMNVTNYFKNPQQKFQINLRELSSTEQEIQEMIFEKEDDKDADKEEEKSEVHVKRIIWSSTTKEIAGKLLKDEKIVDVADKFGGRIPIRTLFQWKKTEHLKERKALGQS